MMLIELFKQHKGYLLSKDLGQNRNLQYAMKDMIARGEVEKLRRGLYKHNMLAELDNWQEISLIYPNAVICMHSACAYYNLTTYMPHQVHLAVSHNQKITLAPYPPVELYYRVDKYFKKHITVNNGVRIYTLERAVCDAIKFDTRIGLDMLKEVVNAYLRREDKQIELLLKTAKEIDAYEKVRKVFEILI